MQDFQSVVRLGQEPRDGLKLPSFAGCYRCRQIVGKNVQQSTAVRDTAAIAGVVLLYLISAWLIGLKLKLFTPDPDYQYLLNSLNILSLRSPAYYDHPGTPIQLLIAVVVGLTWLLTLPWHGVSSLTDDVLAQPQFYMSSVSIVFTVAIAASMTFFLYSMRKASGTIAPALLALFTVIPSYIVYQTFHRVMPEPLLLAATFTLVGVLAEVAFAPKDQATRPRTAAWTGALLGFCVTAKVTSMPAVLILFALRGAKAKAIAAIAAGLSALIFLIPVLPLWRPILRNYFRIATHTGAYGTGGAGVPTAHELWDNALSLASTVPTLFLCPAVYLLLLLASRMLRRPLPASFARILLVCSVIAAVAVALVAKQPHPYYLVSIVPLICFGNALVFTYAIAEMRSLRWIGLLLAVPFAIWAYSIFSSHADLDASDSSADRHLIEAAEHSGCQFVRYYGVQEPQFNLFFGNQSAGQLYSDRLSRMYPDFLAYNVFIGQFQTYKTVLPVEAARKRLASGHCTYLIGIPWQENMGIPASSLKLIGRSKSGLSLYSLASDWDASAYGKR